MKLEAIKGYSTEKAILFLTGDVMKVISREGGEIGVEVVAGWNKGVRLSFSPEIIAGYFKVIGLTYTL